MFFFYKLTIEYEEKYIKNIDLTKKMKEEKI